ncbi:MAG TPA: hypothetical protein PKC76_19675 [Saprospiraceae bacterium]|nr:hypothetical protein [Saprospiraceae bacterium]HMP26357.1 hypothetical protein [Saprospiraceae bacterium]
MKKIIFRYTLSVLLVTSIMFYINTEKVQALCDGCNSGSGAMCISCATEGTACIVDSERPRCSVESEDDED